MPQREQEDAPMAGEPGIKSPVLCFTYSGYLVTKVGFYFFLKNLLTSVHSCAIIQAQAEGSHTRVEEGEAFFNMGRGRGCPNSYKRKTKNFFEKTLDKCPGLWYYIITPEERGTIE